MANHPIVQPQPVGPATEEAFVADRQVFWHRFTRFIVGSVVVTVLILLGMLIFLV